MFLGQSIFYNSLGGRSLHSINLSLSPLHAYSQQDEELTDSLIYGQMSIKAVNLKELTISKSNCLRSNGGCEHFCVPM
jgi:hypothetical protein